MAATHVFETPPPGVAADWTMPQNWDQFTREEHETWEALVVKQSEGLRAYACEAFLGGLDLLHLAGAGIPDYALLNPRLKQATGWEVVAVPGVIPADAFFRHLAERRFPAANFLRSANSLDYSEEPDMFHDLFGHLPMLANPIFADFMIAYGEAGLRAETLGGANLLERLYLHTVEFGLVAEMGGVRAYGAGLLSSYAETVHAVTSPATTRLRFDLPRVMRSGYLFDEFQKTYFVVDSFEYLLKVTAETDFTELYRRLGDEAVLAPDAVVPGDRMFVLA